MVTLRVVRSVDKPHERLGSKEAAKFIFGAMWTPVIMLLLGGFAIAAALSKYHIAKLLATFVLSKAGTRPRTVLITNMFVAMVASMWISNVAAPVLCFSIIQVRKSDLALLLISVQYAKEYLADASQLTFRFKILQGINPWHRTGL